MRIYDLASESTPAIVDDITKSLAWFDGYVHPVGFSLTSKTSIEHSLEVINQVRDAKARHHYDPAFHLWIESSQISNQVIQRYESVDSRLPRITVVAVIDKIDLFEIQRIRKIGSGYLLKVFCELTARSNTELSTARAWYEEVPEPSDVIISTSVSYVDLKDLRSVAENVYRCFRHFPGLYKNVALFSGAFYDFYIAKELWMLKQHSNRQVARFDNIFQQYVCNNFMSESIYNDCIPRRESVAMEHDLDSISDSFECQSPIFVKNKLTLAAEA